MKNKRNFSRENFGERNAGLSEEKKSGKHDTKTLRSISLHGEKYNYIFQYICS